MDEICSYLLKDLDLRKKTILEAAVGAGGTVLSWAKQIWEQGGTSRITAVDIDLSGGWPEKIRERLGIFARYVELREADIFNLDFIESESIDIINCSDTIIFLNPRPLKLTKALIEFRRILKSGGLLFITSEVPVDDESDFQWKRWNLSKAVYDLMGKTWATEPLKPELSTILSELGFRIYSSEEFPQKRDTRRYGNTMDEWREMMKKAISSVPFDELRNHLVEAVENVYSSVLSEGFLTRPAMYALKCQKVAGAGR